MAARTAKTSVTGLPPAATSMQNKQTAERKLTVALVFALAFLGVEVTGGILANSLAIISDAGHMLCDCSSLITSLIGAKLANKGRLKGTIRWDLLIALGNAFMLTFTTLYLIAEASLRIMWWSKGQAEHIDGLIMLTIALIGVIFNGVLLIVLGPEHHHHHHHGQPCNHHHTHHANEGHDAKHLHHPHGADHPPEHKPSADKQAGTGEGYWDVERTIMEYAHKPTAPQEPSPAAGSMQEAGHPHEEPRVRPSGSHGDHAHDHRHEGTTLGGCGHELGVEEGSEVPVREEEGGPTKSHEHCDHDHPHDHDHTPHTHKSADCQHHGHAHRHQQQHEHHPSLSFNSLVLDSAYLHVASDLAQSLGVVVASVIIFLKPTWQVADPILTLLTSFGVLFTTLGFIKRTWSIEDVDKDHEDDVASLDGGDVERSEHDGGRTAEEEDSAEDGSSGVQTPADGKYEHHLDEV